MTTINMKKRVAVKKEKTLSVGEIEQVHMILSRAKISMLNGDDIMRILNLTRKFKKIVSQWNSLRAEVIEKSKDDKFDEMAKKSEDLTTEEGRKKYTAAEIVEISAYVTAYKEKVDSILRPEFDKTYDFEIETLDEEGFKKLIVNNDWELQQVMSIADILCIDDEIEKEEKEE